MPEPKTYAPMSGKEHIFADGGSILKLSGKADKIIAFINEHANDKGYINLTVSRRKTPGQYGDTHSVALDTWKPKGESVPPQAATTETKDDDGSEFPF